MGVLGLANFPLASLRGLSSLTPSLEELEEMVKKFKFDVEKTNMAAMAYIELRRAGTGAEPKKDQHASGGVVQVGLVPRQASQQLPSTFGQFEFFDNFAGTMEEPPSKAHQDGSRRFERKK